MRALPILATLLGLAGCSLLVPKLQAPHLSVVGVELQKGSLWQQKLRVRMHVENPNDRVLPIKGITYTLDVNGQEFAHGESAASFGVPALGEADWARMVGAICHDTGAGWLPDFDPALVDTLAGIDFSKPLPDLWPQFEALTAVPLLAIRGANSKLFSAATLGEMQKRHPAMEAIIVEGQGHAPFLETGDLPQRIAAFLDRAERQV